jgi:hypothetical protein
MATTKKKKSEAPSVTAAFGSKNRNRLIDAYFAEQVLVPETAWSHIYKLLLWIDQTIGLAHCYESDKCQPGKNWYGRSLAFHAWVSSALGTTPSDLAEKIDWLFKRATTDLAEQVVRGASAQAATASRQRTHYEGQGFPNPGEDPELQLIVLDVLGKHLSSEPTPAEWQTLVQRIRQYLTLENKRRNLVGEGFEDTLAAVIRRSPGASSLDVRTRVLLNELPGFSPPKKNDKPNRVDLAIVRPGASRRTLVTAKWSLRADREKQFPTEYAEYVVSESNSQPFEYVFVTNEFDPARLKRACEKLGANTPMFTSVVHLNTDALKATYGSAAEDSMKSVLGHIESGRLMSLKSWLEALVV